MRKFGRFGSLFKRAASADSTAECLCRSQALVRKWILCGLVGDRRPRGPQYRLQRIAARRFGQNRISGVRGLSFVLAPAVSAPPSALTAAAVHDEIHCSCRWVVFLFLLLLVLLLLLLFSLLPNRSFVAVTARSPSLQNKALASPARSSCRAARPLALASESRIPGSPQSEQANENARRTATTEKPWPASQSGHGEPARSSPVSSWLAIAVASPDWERAFAPTSCAWSREFRASSDRAASQLMAGGSRSSEADTLGRAVRLLACRLGRANCAAALPGPTSLQSLRACSCVWPLRFASRVCLSVRLSSSESLAAVGSS